MTQVCLLSIPSLRHPELTQPCDVLHHPGPHRSAVGGGRQPRGSVSRRTGRVRLPNTKPGPQGSFDHSPHLRWTVSGVNCHRCISLSTTADLLVLQRPWQVDPCLFDPTGPPCLGNVSAARETNLAIQPCATRRRHVHCYQCAARGASRVLDRPRGHRVLRRGPLQPAALSWKSAPGRLNMV